MTDDSEHLPWARLACAALVLAVKDARNGDFRAAHWLAHDGADLADLALNVPPDVLSQWRKRGRGARKNRAGRA